MDKQAALRPLRTESVSVVHGSLTRTRVHAARHEIILRWDAHPCCSWYDCHAASVAAGLAGAEVSSRLTGGHGHVVLDRMNVAHTSFTVVNRTYADNKEKKREKMAEHGKSHKALIFAGISLL